MREILFRGKRIDNGEWAEGGYRHEKVGEYFTAVFIIEHLTSGVWEHHRVDPATVGQYTGLTDKNGKKIFEGDIMRNLGNVVECYDGSFCINGDSPLWCWRNTEIIGNIHDDPEPLKGGADNE